MKIKFKLDGKIYTIPQSWSEVSTLQYQQLKSCNVNDDIAILAILLGVEYSVLFNTKQNDIDEKIAPFIKFLNRPFNGKDLPPVTSIKIGDKHYGVPKNLTLLTFGQKIDARNKMNEAIEKNKDTYSCIADVVAIYMQPIVQGAKYNEEDAMKFAREVIDNCSIVETYVVASFFLSNLMQYKQKRTLPYPLNLIRNKYLRGYLNWVYSKKSIQSMLSLMETC